VNVTISSCLAQDVIDFQKAIKGPKIEYFGSRTYGGGVESVWIIFELQNPAKTLKHYSRYFPEDRMLYYHIPLGDELELLDQKAAFKAIALTMQAVLKKSFKKVKGLDFDSGVFEADLMAYIGERIGVS
jgi:hypothetical protein